LSLGDLIKIPLFHGGQMEIVKLQSQSGIVVWIDKSQVTSISRTPVPFTDNSGLEFNWVISLGSNDINVFTNLDYTEAELSEALGIAL
tara:strand:- start:371 stop:634 length:264 start_codon:yes stop_codon:yes gene_type:complete